MGAHPATKTPLCDIPHLVGIPAPEHLLYQAVIVASIVPRVHALEAVPVVGKDLFEEVPGRRSCCSHQAASLQRVGWWVIALFYHIPSMTSTPLAVLTRVLPPPRSPLHHGDFRAIVKWKILCYRDRLARLARPGLPCRGAAPSPAGVSRTICAKFPSGCLSLPHRERRGKAQLFNHRVRDLIKMWVIIAEAIQVFCLVR